MKRNLGIWAVVLLAASVSAQMPNEVLLLVNKQSQASLKVANVYAQTRQIPAQNIVWLDVPESAYGGSATITPEQFTQLIWEPANTAAKERGIDKQILVWVYSVDFPIRVKTATNDRQQMSVGGLTFLRNRVPDLKTVEEGTYLSKLFGGPNQEFQKELPPFSFGARRDGVDEKVKFPEGLEYLREGLGEEMPLPSMMLGYVGEKGTDVDTVLKTIQLGAASDYRGLHSGIYFVKTDDVRSTCRDWQFEPNVQVLKGRGISSVITNAIPAGARNVMGLMMGAETVDPSKIGSFAPGAMAEHLTSWSAEFQKPQTKLTDWLKAGATGTAGSVVEPYSNFNKFPSARFFFYYSAGCTMLESFYQSLASPLQILLLGDPMAKPYAPRINAALIGVSELSGAFTYVVKVDEALSNVNLLYAFYIDGKEVQPFSDKGSYYLRADTLSDGYHRLQVAVCSTGTIRAYCLAEKEIVVNRKNRSVAFQQSIEKLGEQKHGLKVEIKGEEKPETVRLMQGERILDEKPYAEDAVLTLDERVVGEGPLQIQAAAIFEDGMEVRSAPAAMTVKFAE
ncbi:MAG: hypothetical protein JXR23_05800 [Pontiellaceae bacterium]|nr:hypothetical protein [Pontiellaceae bacterium]